MQRDRCWLTHNRRPTWTVCPSCGRPLNWHRTDLDEWVPCDPDPVLYVEGIGKLKILKKRELIENCELYSKKKHGTVKPMYGLMPHYYSCTALIQERREWALKQRHG